MTTKVRELQRITTGVPGLDQVLGGGLFDTGVYILEGRTGSGKTILANQICFHLASQGRRAIYYTLLTESHDRMLMFLQQLEFVDLRQVPNRVSYISGYKVLETEGLPGVVRSVRDVVSQQRPAVLVIDGIVSAEESAPSTMLFKKFMHELQIMAAMFRCAVVVITNVHGSKRVQAEHTMVDGIIELTTEIVRLKARRSLVVSKLRGTAQQQGLHSLEITERGVKVYPHIENTLASFGSASREISTQRCGFGIPSLDASIGGGLLRASNTMLLGPSGTGKTMLSLHYLAAGAAAGQRGLMFTFYERPEELVAKARQLGMTALVAAVERGDVRLLWQSSVEANLDRIGHELLAAVESLQPTRVVIDGMHGFQATSDPPERIQDFFAALADYFRARHATLLYTAEMLDVMEMPITPPFINASRVCQNILRLRYTELRARLVRVWSVVKLRDSDYDPALRTLRIGQRGIELGPPLDTAKDGAT